jgi:hypothetical protein
MEGRSFAIDRLYLDISFVQHHYLLAKTKSNAAAAFFRAEKWYKYFF